MQRAPLLLVGLLGLGLIGKAAADDAGVWQFFQDEARRSSAASPRPIAPAIQDRANAVRRTASVPHLARKRVVHVHIERPKMIARADLPQNGPVTIYNDRTLRRGDAVMTAQGLRVFRGSGRFPYHPSDFVALADASRFVVGDKKQLHEVQVAFERIDVPATQFAALVTGRSVSVGAAASAKSDTESRKIRYVGP